MDNQQEKQKLTVFLSRWLRIQLALWHQKGIIDEGQKNEMMKLYLWPEAGPAAPPREAPSLKLITVLQTIGAVLIGIGVISFIAFNWAKLPNFIKLVLVIIAMVSAHGTGFYLLWNKPDYQKAGFSFIFLGNIIYGAGIWLVAQMYHINYGFTTGMFLWAFGIIPFAYLAKSKLNYFLALALFFIWTAWESIGSQTPHLWYLFILAGLLTPLAYYLQSKTGLALCMVCGGIWLSINAVFWFHEHFSIYVFLPLSLYGLLLLTASNLHLLNDELKQYRALYAAMGTTLCVLALLPLSTFGLFPLQAQDMMLDNLSLSFWLCAFLLAAGGILMNWGLHEKYLDDQGMLIKRMFSFILFAMLYVFVIPYTKHYFILTLTPVALVVFSHWYFSKKKLLLNLGLMYLLLWLSLCSIALGSLLDLLLLFPFYGLACYLLGWDYSRKDDALMGDFFKAFGLAVMFVCFYILSFKQVGAAFTAGHSFTVSPDFWILVSIFYAGALFLYLRINRFTYPLHKQGMLPEEKILVPALLVTPIVLLTTFPSLMAGPWATFLVNFAYLSILVAYLIAGYRRRETSVKALSCVFLIVLVVTRFVGIEWGLLYKSFLFILTGCIVLVLGVILEKNKERIAVIDGH